MGIKSITPLQVYQLQQESGAIAIIDIRDRSEFKEWSSPLAENFPLKSFSVSQISELYSKKYSLFVLCTSGLYSLEAVHLLTEGGFESVYNIEGGMVEWERIGLPVVKG